MTMANNTGGYKYDFAEIVSDELYCKKCPLVARQLRVTSCCGESFCSACIENEKGKPCPHCGSASFSTMELVKYQTEIQNLKVFCSMKERGCDWCDSLKLLDSHLDPTLGDCRYVDIQCPLGCLEILLRIQVDQHVITECKKRPIECPNLCGQTLKLSEIESHKEVCPSEIVECPFRKVGCTEKKLKRAEKEEHTEKNCLKHLELTAKAIENQTVKELKHELQEMEKNFEQQNNLIGEQSIRLQRLEELFSEFSSKRPRLQSGSEYSNPNGMEVKPVPVSKFTLVNFSEEKAKDEFNKVETWPMYTHEYGYKFTIGIDANGFGSSRGKAMRVWMKALPGEYDNQLQWPAKVSFQIELVGNDDIENWIVSNTKTWFKPSATSVSYQSFSYEPTDEYIFIDHCKLSSYLNNDTLVFKITPAYVPPQPSLEP